jgi:lipopolysaccharide export system permease protein
MFRVKRLHTFVLESFLPVFFMTFMISNFILVMQLLWRNMDNLVGKGIDFSVFAEFYWYAALSLVPMSLPLAVLLASLMTFGNFGERLELLAMKSAGISLFNIMKPLIILISFICIGAFYFQDNAMPKVQVKLMSLLMSFKQKSPELSIPEGAFYSDIPGMTIYVKNKDNENKLLKDIMIYDFSEGYDNAAVTLAKTGKLRFTADKKYLVLDLFDGEGFSNFNSQQPVTAGIPYRREMFRKKEMVIDYDDNFNRIDESNFSSFHFSKNTKQLNIIIDSIKCILDSLDLKNEELYTKSKYFNRQVQPGYKIATAESIAKVSKVKPFYPNIDSLLYSENRDAMRQALERAGRRVSEIRSDLEFKQITEANEVYQYRRSSIEFHRKFTLSFACLIFFFIGAPLGAIIRKGGIGLPAVVSVILFIIYYMIDLTGYKFARDGVWNPILGGWISSVAMLPLGLFLTYKAINDSAILNGEAYVILYKTYLSPRTYWILFKGLFHKK